MMKYLLCIVLLLPVVLAAGDRRIIGGEEIDIGDFPWQGSYRTATGSHMCGCVFVGGIFAISAAHCGGSPLNTLEFGATERGTGNVFSISIVTVHPLYGVGAGFDPNDIAVIFTLNPITGPNISPALMAPSGANPGGQGWITGWGLTCNSCALPMTLHGVEIDILPDQECDSRWGNSFSSASMICVYNGGDGACSGDSGGPLSVGNTVYGLTSWGAVGCDATFPSVYTRVGMFKEWVCDSTLDNAFGC